MTRLLTLCLALFLPSLALSQDRVLVLSGLPIWESAPLLQLVQDQPLVNQGIQLEFEPWRAPDELGAKMARQDVNLVSVPAMLAPVFAARGLQFSNLGSSAPAGNLGIVSSASSGALAVPFKGGMPDVILRSLSESTDLSNRQIRYTATPTEAMQLLLTGNASGAFLAEPLLSFVAARSHAEMTVTDVCALWKEVHGLGHCPTTGIYIGVGLSAEESEVLSAALQDSYQSLVPNPDLAASLLRDQFSDLKDVPLSEAFQKLEPTFQPRCKTQLLLATLQVLAPYAPYDTDDLATLEQTC